MSMDHVAMFEITEWTGSPEGSHNSYIGTSNNVMLVFMYTI